MGSQLLPGRPDRLPWVWKKLPGDQLCTKSVRRMPELNAFASPGLRWPTAFRLGDALVLNHKAMMGNDL